MNNKNIKIYIGVGILASILVGLGEYLLHFLPGGPPGEIEMIEHVPLARASKGHFIAVFCTPLYFVGYVGLKEFFKRSSPILANTLYVLGILAWFSAGVWLSSRYFGAEILQTSKGTANYAVYKASYEKHYQFLVWALRIIVALLSIVYITLILKNKQNLPKWLAIFNPTLILIIVIFSLFWFKPLGVHIAPIAMNVTHFFFFGLILSRVDKSS